MLGSTMAIVSTFQASNPSIPGFAFSGGWTVKHHPCFLINLMGTGQADIVRFASGEVNVTHNDWKGGFMPGFICWEGL